LTRAVWLALGGNLSAAFRMHPLFPLGLLLLIGLPFLLWRSPGFLHTRAFKHAAVVLIVAFLAVYAIRMLTQFPDTPPMVYNDNSILGRLLALVGLRGG
jgi:hypothetical protein